MDENRSIAHRRILASSLPIGLLWAILMIVATRLLHGTPAMDTALHGAITLPALSMVVSGVIWMVIVLAGSTEGRQEADRASSAAKSESPKAFVAGLAFLWSFAFCLVSWFTFVGLTFSGF